MLLYLMLSAAQAQEQSLADCADAVDNDGDGDVDLNDADCACSGTQLFAQVDSYISNPSFEELSSCPDDFAQLDRCEDWVQATDGTSDFFACGAEDALWAQTYAGVFPAAHDGGAFVGAIMSPEGGSAYVEYVGGCTASVLEAGSSYVFDLYVAATSGGRYGGDTSGDLQLFGVSACSELPLSGTSSLEGGYTLLDEATVTVVGGGAYQRVRFSFTPTADFEAVVFGASESMVADPSYGGNYLLFDSLTLNRAGAFGTVVVLQGSCEGGGYRVEGPEPVGVDFQWYQDGVAILGAQGTTYEVPVTEGGTYTLRVDDGADCNLTTNDLDVEVCPIDSDGDGVFDSEEDRNGDGDPDNDDTDGDGLPDYLDVDDDGDGVDTADEDRDGDGDPTNDDSDGDGTPDYLDLDSDGDGVSDAEEAEVGSDPTLEDSDGDGLTDAEELRVHGSDPTNVDTDGDGLSDGEEVLEHGADPTLADTDGGGVPDGVELRLGADPLAPGDDGGRYRGGVGCGATSAPAGAAGSLLGLLALLGVLGVRRRKP